jgi:predicted secreted protein
MKTFRPGESITVRAAEEFELSVPGLGAAGYEWKPAEATPGLTFLGSFGGEAREESTERVGGEFPERLRFRADRAGTFSVHLVCRRSFGDTTPVRDLTVQVVARRRA